MTKSNYWADNFQKNKRSLEQAIGMIKSGQRIFIGSSSGEPQYLVKGLAEHASRFTDLEIVRMLSSESTSLTEIAKRPRSQNLNIRSFYLGSAKTRSLAGDLRFFTPINLSAVPRLFKSRLLPLHVALIQVTPPDDFGWMSLGISVDIGMAAAEAADLVIAQVNPRMPRVLGRSFVHVNDIDVFVEHEEDLIENKEYPDVESASVIAGHVSRLIDDGSTIQTSLGATGQATVQALSDKNDIGIHTQFITDSIMKLVSRGVVNNRKKGINDGKLVGSNAIGTKNLYEFLDDNPSVEFHPSNYVNDPRIISSHNKMVAMNVGMEIDLTGQVAADALPYNHFSGITGMLDFFRGASMSPGGKTILMMTSTAMHGNKSRIVPILDDTAVVVPRGEVQHVVTEYGSVNLFGKSLQERAMALISIAHPEFRDGLFVQAKEMGLLAPERTIKESIQGVYPLGLEEKLKIDGEEVTFRPVKPVDQRIIQEHYYNLDKQDVVSRFFHEKTSFDHDQIESTFIIDYVKDLTIVAVVGESGFERIIAVGEYFLNEAVNTAEIAFSVTKEWQGKGISRHMIRKLSEAARDNGISGLTAYTSPENHRMIKLFKSMPHEVKSTYEDDMIVLSCFFSKNGEK